MIFLLNGPGTQSRPEAIAKAARAGQSKSREFCDFRFPSAEKIEYNGDVREAGPGPARLLRELGGAARCLIDTFCRLALLNVSSQPKEVAIAIRPARQLETLTREPQSGEVL
jgi:hypothetical protein